MRESLWDFNRFSLGKPCQKRLLSKRQLLILIDLNMNPSPQDGFIVAQDRSFLKPRRSGKSGTSHTVAFEHAKASAALAASFKSRFHSSYKRGCQGKKLLPAPLRDAGVVTYIQPHLIPHLILRGVIGLVALARRTSPRRCQPQLLVPTRRFHEVSGARRRSVPKLRKLKRWLKCQPRSYVRLEAYSFFRLSEGA